MLDFYIMMGPDPEEVIRQYQDVVGKPLLPPFWSLGYHQSKWVRAVEWVADAQGGECIGCLCCPVEAKPVQASACQELPNVCVMGAGRELVVTGHRLGLGCLISGSSGPFSIS